MAPHFGPHLANGSSRYVEAFLFILCFKNIQFYYISKVGSGSIGTTTTGADVSPVIPALKWSSIIEDALNLTISDPDKTYPLFLIDSEGMGVRGDAFDFMTTSPPAIVAKVHNFKI